MSLYLLEPALILAEACRISVCFSLASLKGSLSFPFPFHCLLPAHQPGQLQQVIWSQCLSERGHTCTCASLQRKVGQVVIMVKRRRRSCAEAKDGSAPCVTEHCAFSFYGHSFLKHLSMIGGVRVSGSNLIQPLWSLEKEVWPAVRVCVQIESNPSARPPLPPPLLDSHSFIIHHSTAVRWGKFCPSNKPGTGLFERHKRNWAD